MIKIILAFVTALMTMIAPLNQMTAPVDDSDFLPVVRFAVASDTHIQTAGATRSQRMQKVLSLAYSDAQQDEHYKTLDAMLWAGDLTDNGNRYQFLNFVGTLNSVVKPETKVMGVVAKSHDGSALGKKSLPYFTKVTGQPTDFHYTVNGFHFIGISASLTPGEHYSEYQRTWLKEQLAEAAAEDSQKPIFVMHHEHVKDTVYGSTDVDGWGMDYFSDILEQYPQIVDFSGHSHYPLNDPRSIWQGAFTAVGTGALKYAEFTVDGQNTIHPEGYKKIAQAWIVEVDKDNTVRLRGFDALSGDLLCEYYVENPADAAHRQFTPAQQEAKATAPQFAEGAALKVKKIFGKYKVTAPAAQSTDGTPVALYRITIMDDAGKQVDSMWILNNYWHSVTYSEITETVKAQKGYSIQVTAENAYGMQSAPLVYTVTK